MEYLNKVQEIELWLVRNKIDNYKINDDLSIDVDGGVWLTSRSLVDDNGVKKIPYKFNKVKGVFVCNGIGLDTLENTPYNIKGYFDCSKNNLKSLKYSPKVLKGDNVIYNCSNNKLTDLNGAPLVINGSFKVNGNYLSSLSRGPKVVYGDYIAFNQKGEIKISSFNGFPETFSELDFDGNGIEIFINIFRNTDIELINSFDSYDIIEKPLKEGDKYMVYKNRLKLFLKEEVNINLTEDLIEEIGKYYNIN